MKNINPGLFFRKWDSVNLGLSYLVLWIPITSFLNSIFGEYSQQTFFFKVLQIVYILSIVNALPAIKDTILNKKVLLIAGCVSLVYLISYSYCSISEIKSEMNRTIVLWCLPYLLFSASIKDVDGLIKDLRFISLVVLTFESMNSLVFRSVVTYSQDVGYNCIIPTILFFTSYLLHKKLWYLIPVVIGIVVILFSGSRGPLLSVLLGMGLSFLAVLKYSRKFIVISVVITLLLLIFYAYKDEILSWAISLFSSLGVSTRTLESMLNNNLGDDHIRGELREAAWQYAKERPIVGGGFFADRIYLYNKHIIISKTATYFGSYSHNIFLELMMQFGLIPGLLLCLYLLKALIKKVRYCFDSSRLILLLMSICIGLLPLLVSRSWLSYPFFYLLVGVMCNPLYKNSGTRSLFSK